MNEELKALPHWTDLLTERNRLLVQLSTVYSDHYEAAGDVAHNYKLLVAQLAEILNRVSEKTGIVIPELYRPEG